MEGEEKERMGAGWGTEKEGKEERDKKEKEERDKKEKE